MKTRKRLWMAALLAGILAVAAAVTTYGKERLAAPDDTFWDGEKATWGEVENAYKYQIRLYLEGSYVSGSEVETKKTSYSLKSKMEKEGYYSFRVRALAKGKDYTDSNWSDYSDENVVSEEEAERIKTANEAARLQKIANVNTGGSGPGDDGSQTTQTGQTSASGEWKMDAAGWWYAGSDGSYPKSQWQEINGAWYYFNEQGYMFTGWLTLGEKTYYCQPESGAMLTGTHEIDGETCIFDNSGEKVQ